MTKGKKFKKAVRARAAKTGQHYQGALRHERPFEEVVLRVIDLAERAQEERNERVGVDAILSAADLMELFLQKRKPAAQALHDAVMGLPHRVAEKLQTLMYAGRERDRDLHGLHASLSKHRAAQTVLSKRPALPRYLRDGLRIAKRARVDLEADFGVARGGS